MTVTLSNVKKGLIAVAGHVGCGHGHSLNNQVQDDSVGLATVLALFQEATGLSLVIKDIRVKAGTDGFIEVETESGGIGQAFSRRGITLHEARLAKFLIGREAVRTQTLVLEAFGRIYGQGVHETPVALQTAIANAALDSFVKNFPSHFIAGYDDLEGSCGLIAGTILDFSGIPVAVLGTVNASSGGIGPNEDSEGNVAVGVKRDIMAQLGMLQLPTFVIEAKLFSEKFLNDISECTFLVRADNVADNPIVAQSMIEAGKFLNHPVKMKENLIARVPGGMEGLTKELASKVINLGERLSAAKYSQEKISVLSDLALLISQDGAGISFMSNKLHEIVGGAGMLPGTSAVFNYVVTKEYIDEFVMPFMTEEDLSNHIRLLKESIKELAKVLPSATEHVNKYCMQTSLEHLVLR